MCGILGAIPSIDEPLFRRALGQLAHRGPDGEALWRQEDGNIMLGHRRLAIIDLSESGIQPMQRDSMTITCNGEFYNYHELKHRLSALGHRFRSESDTEVFLAAWQQWGPKALLEFNGMWAFGLWDDSRKSLILGRDRFGKKPLFYLQKGDQFYFASEMKALYPFLDAVRPASNFRQLAAEMRNYEASSECLVEGIKRFPAGHWGEYKDGRLELHRYWNTLDHLETPPATFSGQVERFRELFDDACRLRLISDVPVGASLSGGLDSGSVVATMAGLADSPSAVEAFVAGFHGSPIDESSPGLALSSALDVVGHRVNIQAPSADQLMQQLRMFEELHDTCPSPMVATYAAMREKGIYVSLDGHGADESMAGYGEGSFHAFGDCGWSISAMQSILTAFNHYYPNDPYFHKPKANLLTAMAYKWRGGGDLPKDLVERLGHFGAYLYGLFHETVFPVMLRNFDRYSMMNGVEIRMPFADHRLVTYLFSLPWNAKIRNGYTKAILRESMKGRLWDETRLKRAKIGFSAPLVQWMQGPWREFLSDFSASKAFRESDLGDGTKVAEELRVLMGDSKANYFDGMRVWGKVAPFLWESAVLGGK